MDEERLKVVADLLKQGDATAESARESSEKIMPITSATTTKMTLSISP
jgi:hypothetical protein